MISREISKLQKTIVNEIISEINRKLENNDSKFLTFKSPTGSGKTHMMLDLMNRILKNDKAVIFIVSSLSTNGLADQIFNVFKKYSQNFSNIKIGNNLIGDNEGNWLYIEPNFNVYVLSVDKYKKGSLLKDGPNGDILEDFLYSEKNKKKKIYLIKDESHRATKNLSKLEGYFDFILNFSATPNHKVDVELSKQKCEDCGLIKHVTYNSYELNDYGISEYKKIKKQYNKHNIPCNPALIIQISNSKHGEVECSKIKKFLPQINTMQQYSNDSNLQWVIIGDKRKNKSNQTNNKDLLKIPKDKWIRELAKPLCPVSIIIFKLIIKEGYDIPRACMLYQVRDTKSKSLDEQVIGRICRNPILKQFGNYCKNAQKLALTATVWGITDKKNDDYKIDLILKQLDKFKINFKTTKINNLLLSNERNSFNIDEILSNKQVNRDESIFQLHKKWVEVIGNDNDIVAIKKQIKNDDQWFRVMSNLEFIKIENEKKLKNYEKSIIVDKDKHGFLNQTYCWNRNENEISGDDFWPYNNQKNSLKKEFPLESKAESDFYNSVISYFKNKNSCNDIKIFGKNFYLLDPDHAIKYGYVNDGIKTTYPDFIIKIKKYIYIVEVKSNVEAGKFSPERAKEYQIKYESINEAYTATSKKITDYFFVVAIKENDKSKNNWTIFKSYKGIQKTYHNIDDLFN